MGEHKRSYSTSSSSLLSNNISHNESYENLASAQPPANCSFARRLVGKIAISCSLAHHQAPARNSRFNIFPLSPLFSKHRQRTGISLVTFSSPDNNFSVLPRGQAKPRPHSRQTPSFSMKPASHTQSCNDEAP